MFSRVRFHVSRSDRQRSGAAQISVAVHAAAQLLKTDIEGFEWEVFDDFFERGDVLPFSQILVRQQIPRPDGIQHPVLDADDALSAPQAWLHTQLNHAI